MSASRCVLTEVFAGIKHLFFHSLSSLPQLHLGDRQNDSSLGERKLAPLRTWLPASGAPLAVLGHRLGEVG